MYRTTDGKSKFSFTRLLNNAIPSFPASDEARDLTAEEKDRLFNYQVNEPDPLKLCDMAFLMGGVTDSKQVSTQVYNALKKKGVLNAETGEVNTKGITPQFAHQVPMISSHAQKKLICLLFFWEEECQRWRVLIEEQAELRTIVAEEKAAAGEPKVGGYEKRLKELDGLLRLRPSMRGQAMQDAEALPGYEERRR